MSDLPKIIKIGGVDYEVHSTPQLTDAEDDGQRVPVNGLLVHAEDSISIRDELAPGRKRVTLVHEILHALLYFGGGEDHDEHVLDLLSEGLLMVLRDNPALIDYLTKASPCVYYGPHRDTPDGQRELEPPAPHASLTNTDYDHLMNDLRRGHAGG